MLNDPRITSPLARIVNAASLVETYNDPMTRSGQPVVRSKPGSREPGAQQCEASVREVARVLERAAKDCERAVLNARPREPRAQVVTRVGGVIVREERVKSHLVAKYGTVE